MGQVSFKPPQIRAVVTTPTEPGGVAGKLLWLRAKDLTLSSSPTTWPDQSGLGHDATLTAATVQAFGKPPDTATASSTNNFPVNVPANAFDGDHNTIWDSNATATGWVQGQWTTGFAATQYRIRRRDDQAARMPKDFTLQGSNNGSSWTTLDTRTNITWPTSGETKTFTFTNSTVYTYYRLDVTANNGDSYLSFMNLVVSAAPAQAVLLAEGSVSVPSDGGAGTEREIWYVVASRGVIGDDQEFSNLGSVNDHANYPYTNGNVYTSEYITTKSSYTPTMSINVPRIYRVSINSAGAFRAELDNVLQYSATKTLGIKTSSPKIATSWSGQLAEVLVRSQVSTPEEVASLTAYFNTEYGLTVT
jgi:hypothetical protein